MAEIRPIDRLSLYLEHKNISSSKAEKALGIANAYIQNSKTRKGEIGSGVLSRIEAEFLDINLIWLITGKGDMLLADNNISVNSTNTPDVTVDKTSSKTDKKANSVSPTKHSNVSPTVSATHNLGLPKVIVVNDNNEDLVTLVSVKAAAGYLNGYSDPEFVERLPTLRIPNLKGGTHRGFEVKGHSMSPTIHNGSIAVGRWEESFEDIRENYVYIVVTRSEGIVVKRVLNRISETGRLILKSDNNNKREYQNIILDPTDVIEMWRLRGSFIFEFPEPNELNHRVNDLEAKFTLLADQMQKLLK